MKYSEFLQLNEILEENGTSVSKELGLKPLNELGQEQAELARQKNKKPVSEKSDNTEAEDAKAAAKTGGNIETKGGNIFTKWGRIKRGLNKEAKKVQQNTIKQVNKYLPKILEAETYLANAYNELQSKNIDASQILRQLQPQINKVKQLQTKQRTSLENFVERQLNNSTKTFSRKIDSSESSKSITGLLDATSAFFKGGKDVAALKLKNYWELLRVQVELNIYAYISNYFENNLQTIIKDPKALEYYLSEVSSLKTAFNEKINAEKETITRLTSEFKKEENEIKADKPAEDKPDEDKPAEPTEEVAVTAENLEPESSYVYTQIKTDERGKQDKRYYPLKYIGQNKDGKFKFEISDQDGKEISVSSAQLKNITKSKTNKKKEEAK